MDINGRVGLGKGYNPLNPLPSASDLEPKDVIKVEDTIDDGLLPGLMKRDINYLFGWTASLSRRLCGRETAHALVKKKGKSKDKYYAKLILYLGNEVHSSVEQGTAVMEKLVKKLGNAEEKVECKKLKKELEEARGFVFEERPNKAFDVLVEDEKSPSSEPIMPPKSAPLTQLAICRIIKESVDAVIAAERARHANAKNDARGSEHVVRAVELRRWFEKTESVFGISECAEGKKRFSKLALMCPRMVYPKSVKVDAYIRGLTHNIKGEVTSSKPANLNEAVRMAHKLMEQKLQARDERILEGKKWNVRAMITAPTDGKVSSGSLPVCERYFTRHVGPCTIKCHKCGKVRHKAMYCKEKNVATGVNAQPIPTCYDCGEQGHTRNRCPKKVKQEETGEVRG
ncbi:putative reverse transcriptase domain-containing protein [Tanacetum coccineum]